MIFKTKCRYAATVLCAFVLTTLMLTTVFATTVTLLDGKVSVSDTGNTGTLSNGTVTITIKSTVTTRKTNTVTIKNESDSAATLEFDYAASNLDTRNDAKQLVIDGTDYSETKKSSYDGAFSKLVAAGESITITFTAPALNQTATLKLSNFSLTAAAANPNVTIQFGSGSVTVDGVGVNNNDVKSISSTTGATIAATSANFVGWIDTSNNKILSTSASFDFIPAKDVTIKAIHGPTARFCVEKYAKDGFLFETLSEAVAYAATSTKVVILANTGTLPAGDHTIPEGVTLLIPFDSANTLYTTEPGHTGDTYTKPTTYRTLNMTAGATITVQSGGAISVSGKHSGHQTQNGAPSGPQGFIDMDTSSAITVETGGTLYAWGYIIGSGTVTIKSGATVHECFQVTDWRGADCTIELNNDKSTYKLFPFSQYYIQNVQVPMTLEANALEKCYFSVSFGAIGGTGTESAPAPLIGDGGLFRIKSGSVTKDYDEKNDRLILDANGEVELSTMSITVQVNMFPVPITINSSGFIFPINNNITVNLHENSVVTVSQDLSLLPGAIINVKEGATLNLADGTSMYLYDEDDWGGYCYISGVEFMPITYAPEQEKVRSNNDMVSAKLLVNGIVDASNASLCTTNGGAQICSTDAGRVKISGKIFDSVIKQIDQGGDGNDEILEVFEIPVTSAQLLNGDGTTYVSTSLAIANDIYYYDQNVWKRLETVEIMGGANDDKTYGSIGQALDYYEAVEDGSVYLKMIANSAETSTIDETVYLDLGGYTVNSVSIDSNGKLYGMDSATDDYSGGGTLTVTSGTDKIEAPYNYDPDGTPETGPDTTILPKHYVAVANGSAYSFPRVSVSVTGVQFLRSNNTYHAVFRGNYKSGANTTVNSVGFEFVNMDETTASASKTDVTGSDFAFYYGKDDADKISTAVATATVNGSPISSIPRNIANLFDALKGQ